jgi:hypothetical protein
MVTRKLFGRTIGEDTADTGITPAGAPLGGTRAEAVQRLQVGLFGIGAMILLVALASVIGSQADLTEDNAVPDAAPTTEPTDAPPQRDPLADAGIVPDVPAKPTPAPAPSGGAPILPERGGSGNRSASPDDTPDF